MAFAIFFAPTTRGRIRRGAYSIPQCAVPHTTLGQRPAHGFTFLYVSERLCLSVFSLGRVSLGQYFLFRRSRLFGWLPEMLFQIHAEFDDCHAFTLEKFPLEQGMRTAN